ncbi:MAG: DUF1127 domain-containing protein [Rhodospirillales bacterium]|nr:DUF1127 domain-containing protein [Rhodospirillales bacterium]
MEPHVSHYLDARQEMFNFGLLALFHRRGPGPLSRLRAWQEKRRAIRDLSRLDDHLLADIGLSRGGIRSVVESLIAAEAANDNRASRAA